MRRVGKYELTDLLGRGGMGEVWKARDTELGRVVALKLMTRKDDELMTRFQREARVIARLNHPNIAQMYDVGSDPPYIAMQFIDGLPLTESPLGQKEKAAALRDAARAVHYAHGQAVLHRDLKPANILVDGQGRAAVVDFGMAREIRTKAQAMTATGDVIGTPSYMAPEQAMGNYREIDARTDVYGLGATLYAILTGRPPHLGPNAYEIIRRVAEEEISMPRGDPELAAIAMKAMDRDRRRRYASAAEFAEDLDRHLRGDPIAAAAPSPAYRLAKRIRRHPLAWGLGAAAVAALIAGGTFGAVQLSRGYDVAIQREREGQARSRAESARHRLEKVKAALYVDGCSLAAHDAAIDEARRECREALAIVPNFAPAMHWMGMSYFIVGDDDAAVTWLERAVKGREVADYMWADLGRAHLSRGFKLRAHFVEDEPDRDYVIAGEMERAADCFREAGEFGRGIDYDVAHAYLHWAQDEWEDVERLAVNARERYGAVPGLEEIEFLLGVIGPEAERPGHLEEAIRLRPGFYMAYLARSEARRWKEDEAAAALQDLDRAIEINPRFVVALVNRGHLKAGFGDVDGAIQDCSEAIKHDPKFAAAYCNRGGAWMELSRRARRRGGAAADRELMGKALSDLEQALRLKPLWASAWASCAQIRRAMGDGQKAREDVERALSINPNCSLAFFNRAQLRLDDGDAQGAADDMREFIRRNPGDGEAYLNLAMAEDRLGRASAAEETFTRALELLKESEAIPRSNAYLGRGVIRSERGDEAGAVDDYSAAIEADPDFAAAYKNRAGSYIMLGRYRDALEDTQAAERLQPGDPVIWYYRAEAHRFLREWEAGEKEFTRVIDAEPKNADARLGRGICRANVGKLSAAAEDVREALKVAASEWHRIQEAKDALKAIEARLDEDF